MDCESQRVKYLMVFECQRCCERFWSDCITLLVENARKFRESAPNQIPIFRGEPPPVGVSENVWFVKFERVDRANVRSKEQI